MVLLTTIAPITQKQDVPPHDVVHIQGYAAFQSVQSPVLIF